MLHPHPRQAQELASCVRLPAVIPSRGRAILKHWSLPLLVRQGCMESERRLHWDQLSCARGGKYWVGI